MKSKVLSIFFLLCSLPFLVGSGDGVPRKVRPYVVIDGDTFMVATTSQVYRLWGVDAPEIDQRWGNVAAMALRTLIHKRAVTIVSTHGETYGRPVVRATLRGRDIGLEMIKMGLAWHDPRFAPDMKEYAEAMAEAKAAGRGLWSDKFPVAPWDYRAAKEYEVIDEE